MYVDVVGLATNDTKRSGQQRKQVHSMVLCERYYITMLKIILTNFWQLRVGGARYNIIGSVFVLL